MRRRLPAEAPHVPARLWAFRPEDWTGTPLDRWRAWHHARRDHYATAPDSWPDVVTLLVDAYDVRGQIAAEAAPRRFR